LKRIEGEWFEVFRTNNAAEPTDSYCNRDSYKNTSEGYVLCSFDYTTADGVDHMFDGNKIYPSNDEFNSWWHIYFNEVPSSQVPAWIGTLIDPLVRRYGANYMVLDMDENYQWIIVGEPCRMMGWMLQIGGSKKLDKDFVMEKKNL